MQMKLADAIKNLIARQDLSWDDMTSVMTQIMTGEATAAQIGGFLVGLQMKGETVTEIAAAATVMRSLATAVDIKGEHIVDTCGTGGDGAGIFNVSTASAFVVAAAGGIVAKHGNRSVSSRSGSADVLEAAGVRLELSPAQLKQCIETLGVGFLFAQKHHSAMKYAIGPRREMGVRTVFNLLGPLTNPARSPNQVIGVFDKRWLDPMAQVLQKLGSHHVLVVHADDGLDEISIAAATQVAELKNSTIQHYTLQPEDFGLAHDSLDDLIVENPQQSLAIIKQVFAGRPGPARDIIVLNAGAAIYAANLVDTLEEGIQQAQRHIDNGGAQAKLKALVNFTHTATTD